MVVTKNVMLGTKAFFYTYSDAGFYIERDGALYEEAYDVEEKVYTESSVLIEGAAESEDYEAALAQLGVSNE